MFTKTFISVVGIVIALIFCTPNSFAQPLSKVVLKAKVIDSISKQAIENSNISLYSLQNKLLSHTMSQADGSFQLILEPQSKYRLLIANMGYINYSLNIQTADSTSIKLGAILLQPVSTSLSAITVMANKPLIKQEIDRLSYDLEADPERQSLSLLEMMRKVPLLSVDGEGNVELKGSANYRILINGKPSAMMDRNMKEVLRSMPAATIQKIEVITTPPSKYDAEGLAGIINIITHKKLPAGYSATLNTNFSTPTGGPGAGGSFSARSGKLGFTLFTGGGIYDTPLSFDYNNRTATNTFLSQQNQKEKNSRSGYIGTELSYEIDSLQLLAVSFNKSGSRENSHALQSSQSQGQLIQAYQLQNELEGNGNSTDASFNYQLGSTKNKEQLFTLSYRYYAYGYANENHLNFSQQQNHNQAAYQQYDKGNSNEHTLQLDYITKVKKIGIEAGIKSIFRNNSSDFLYLEQNGFGDFEPNPQRSNQFNNQQNVYAAYNTYQFGLGRFSVKAGIRLELTQINADFLTNQTSLNKKQFNLLPAIAIGYRLSTSSTFNFGFMQRIQRPGIYQLNPFVNRANPNVESSGNPALKAVVANAIQMGYSLQKKVFINLSVDYTFFNSLINQVAVFDASSNITRSTYQNTGTAKLLGLNLNANYPISKNWSFATNSKLFYGKIEGISGNVPISTSGLMYSIGANSGYKFEKGWRANASFNYKSPSFTLQRESNALTSSSFSVSKELIARQLTLSIVTNNPFQKYRTNQTVLSGPGFEQLISDVTYFRSYRISLNYSFGKLTQAVKKSKRSIKNDDVAN